MLKKTISYTDFDGQPQTDTLYFNLTSTDLSEMLDLLPRLEKWQNITAEEDRDLTVPEVHELLDIVKEIAQRAYGERSANGRQFRKSDEIYGNFRYSAAYDAFIMGMFTNIEELVSFLQGVLPAELLTQLQQSTTNEAPALIDAELPATPNRPAWETENREPTRQEITSMTPDQLREAFAAKAFAAKLRS